MEEWSGGNCGGGRRDEEECGGVRGRNSSVVQHVVGSPPWGAQGLFAMRPILKSGGKGGKEQCSMGANARQKWCNILSMCGTAESREGLAFGAPRPRRKPAEGRRRPAEAKRRRARWRKAGGRLAEGWRK